MKEAEMQIRDYMNPSPITVTPETSVADARDLLRQHGIRHLLVVEDERLVGIITDRDIRLVLPSPATSLSVWEINYLLAKLTVEEVMTRSVITIGPDRRIAEAVRLLLEHKIGALPVTAGGRVVGIITETNLLRAFAQLLGERTDLAYAGA